MSKKNTVPNQNNRRIRIQIRNIKSNKKEKR